MRRKLCTILYKLGLRNLAYHVSPSVYFMLVAKNFAKDFMRGFNGGKAL